MTRPYQKFVVHCKKSDYDVYIGRPSKWGNPFAIGRDGTREEVIEKYRKFIMREEAIQGMVAAWEIGMSMIPPTIEEIQKELKGKILGCWCSPHECHGEVLAEIANDKNIIKWE